MWSFCLSHAWEKLSFQIGCEIEKNMIYKVKRIANWVLAQELECSTAG